MSLKVAFLSNKLTLRGSEVALYDYAHYNETLLGNESFIVTRDVDRIRHEFDVSLEAYERFAKRFGRLLFYESMTDIERHIQEQGIDVLYIIKSGEPHDGLITTKCRCVVHAVFNPTRPHGDRFAVIHEQLNKLFGTRVPVVPYIVALPSQEDLPDLRQALGIAATAVVFARYGGNESFDIPWVQETVVHVAGRHPEICFVFLNTWRFGPPMPNVLFLAGTSDVKRKVQLIRASSALLHGRGRGETFGLTCGEFASQGKPVITYAGSPEKAHIDILGADKALLYHDRASLTELLLQPVPFWVAASEKMRPNGYTEYTPERVMSAFKKVFLE